ncbi:MAG: deoxyribodipyrimidine photolyase [Longimicrobiales bacterium]
MTSNIPESRLRILRDEAPRGDGDYVLYWMTAARRLSWNFALDRAIEWAVELGKPLVVFEPLRAGYRWASARHHQTVIEGMADQARRLAGSPITYVPFVEPEPGAGRGLLSALADHAACVITDESPTFFLPRLLEAGRRAVPCRMEAVDGIGLLPLYVPGRSFSAAYHFRRYLHKELPGHLGAKPSADPLAAVTLRPLDGLPGALLDRWPVACIETGSSGRVTLEGFASLPIDHAVSPVSWRGGETHAREQLQLFLASHLDRYAEDRNHPDLSVVSGLSPALHYGHISAHEIFHEIIAREGWTPARISPPHDGRRRGWWGMSEAAEGFIDQLVTWREVGHGYCHYEPEYRSYDSLPAWAIETLETHASDPRPWLYSREQFESASTHDEIWNAAQRQLVEEGVIHNYLRMLWGKKILEWSAHPREALDTMVELNNKYATDGRDPNSWSGIMWVMGRFDRGWPERAVFGKVRSMSSDSTRRKVRLDRYLSRWGAQPELL